MSEVELDISEMAISLVVKDRYKLQLPFTQARQSSASPVGTVSSARLAKASARFTLGAVVARTSAFCRYVQSGWCMRVRVCVRVHPGSTHDAHVQAVAVDMTSARFVKKTRQLRVVAPLAIARA